MSIKRRRLGHPETSDKVALSALLFGIWALAATLSYALGFVLGAELLTDVFAPAYLGVGLVFAFVVAPLA